METDDTPNANAAQPEAGSEQATSKKRGRSVGSKNKANDGAKHATKGKGVEPGPEVDLSRPHDELFKTEGSKEAADVDASPSSQDAPDLDEELRSALIQADAPEITLSGVDFTPIYAALLIRNPKRTEAFRVYPRQGSGFVFNTIKASIPMEYGGTGREEDYILVGQGYLRAAQHPTLAEAIRPKEFRLAVNSVGEPFLIVDNLGDPTLWGPTKRVILDEAVREWRAMTSKQSAGMYHSFPAEDYGTPKWPKQSANELVSLTLKPKIVRDGEHPLFKAVKVKIVTNDKDKDDKRRD